MGSRRDKAGRPRCWCCGTKFVDKAMLLNERQGLFRKVYHPTGELVCPNGCPPKDEYDEVKAQTEAEVRAAWEKFQEEVAARRSQEGAEA